MNTVAHEKKWRPSSGVISNEEAAPFRTLADRLAPNGHAASAPANGDAVSHRRTVRNSSLVRANHFSSCAMRALHEVRRRIDSVRLEVTGFIGEERPKTNRDREKVLAYVDGRILELLEAVSEVERHTENVNGCLTDVRRHEQEARERDLGAPEEEDYLDQAAEE